MQESGISAQHIHINFPYTASMSRVATIQMVSTDDLNANLAQAAALIREAALEGAELALLPEYFPLMSDDETAKVSIGETPGKGPIQDFLAGQASDNRIWLMAGTLSLQSAEATRVYNSCLLYDVNGMSAYRYDKMHLFDVQVKDEGEETYNESDTIVPGRKTVVADTPLGRIGMTVCYDLRFPELYRALSEQRADIITVPAAFTYATGKRHWELFLRARAVENLCYVIAANQSGQNTGTRRTWGHSMIIDPWGDILCSLEQEPGVACADIDLARMHELRQSFPALEHRVL